MKVGGRRGRRRGGKGVDKCVKMGEREERKKARGLKEKRK